MAKFLRLTVNGQVNCGTETSINIEGLGPRAIDNRKITLLEKAKRLSKNVYPSWQKAEFGFIIE